MSATLALDLPRHPSAPARARLAVRRELAADLDPDRLDRLQFVVSELVTNAVVHGEQAIHVTVHADADRVTGEVVDGGSGLEAELGEDPAGRLEGPGYLIVEALAPRWGVHDGSTQVWFELDADDPEGYGPRPGEAHRPDALDG
jgi:anti-sigma regulatory factor (Ser/Thr protein kinase)